ncbi:hypothetical protein ACH5RR_021053 [Cinchona calisaya]|uniref:Uncharacterized protein n=1 Tax=Cinchona calisaya TaxID=153742 RepID=A0ABD2ZH80_9GENT
MGSSMVGESGFLNKNKAPIEDRQIVEVNTASVLKDQECSSKLIEPIKQSVDMFGMGISAKRNAEGDFNEILHSLKSTGGSRGNWQSRDFRLALEDCDLIDLCFVGYPFT